jgi:hypothetical protein
MEKIILSQEASQEIKIEGKKQSYTLRIFFAHGQACYDLDIEGTRVVGGQRLFMYQPIIPNYRKDGEQLFLAQEDALNVEAKLEEFGKSINIFKVES